MAGDYIPDGDARFDAWQSNFVTYVNDHLADRDVLQKSQNLDVLTGAVVV